MGAKHAPAAARSSRTVETVDLEQRLWHDIYLPEPPLLTIKWGACSEGRLGLGSAAKFSPPPVFIRPGGEECSIRFLILRVREDHFSTSGDVMKLRFVLVNC